MSGATFPRSDDHLLTPENSALVLIDYQPEQINTVASVDHDSLMLNAETIARAARAFELPVVLSTVGVEMGVNRGTDERLLDALPETDEIDRTTLNSWEDADFRAAVESTGRRKILMTGLWTEVCVAFPTLDMIRQGYEIYPVVDAIGGVSAMAHDSAMDRMIQAGAHPVTAVSAVAELQRDWGRDGADRLRSILQWYFGRRQDG
ncbi:MULTISPECIES: hydrolase [Actinomycetes]|uniref:Hydrolase n=2 Tax=Actinomycetes TaxID=1760 RepID=A0ABP6LRN0_9MICC